MVKVRWGMDAPDILFTDGHSCVASRGVDEMKPFLTPKRLLDATRAAASRAGYWEKQYLTTKREDSFERAKEMWYKYGRMKDKFQARLNTINKALEE